MRFTKIAKAAPFEGAPRINLASVFGASPKKPLILRIPVIGERLPHTVRIFRMR